MPHIMDESFFDRKNTTDTWMHHRGIDNSCSDFDL